MGPIAIPLKPLKFFGPLKIAFDWRKRVPSNFEYANTLRPELTYTVPALAAMPSAPSTRMLREVDQLLETVFASSKFGL